MTPNATRPALQKNAATANRMKTLENNDAGVPAGAGGRPRRRRPRTPAASAATPGGPSPRPDPGPGAAARAAATVPRRPEWPALRSGRRQDTGGSEHARDQQRPEQRPGEVQRLVHGEAAPPADGRGHGGQQHSLRRASDGFADPVTDNQRGGQDQSGRPCRGRHCEQGDADGRQDIAGQREGPVFSGAVRPRPEHHAQPLRRGLRAARHQPHHQGGGAELGQQGTRRAAERRRTPCLSPG